MTFNIDYTKKTDKGFPVDCIDDDGNRLTGWLDSDGIVWFSPSEGGISIITGESYIASK